VVLCALVSDDITSLIESVKRIFDPTEPEYTTTTLVVIVVDQIGVSFSRLATA